MIRPLTLFTLVALFLSSCAGASRLDNLSPLERLSDFPHVFESNDQTYSVGVRIVGEGNASTPPFDSPYSLELGIERRDGDRSLLDRLEIEVDCTMPQHGHGMNSLPRVEKIAPGRFAAHGFELFMEGEWLLTIDITVRREGSERGAPFSYTERAQWWVEPQ